MLHGIRERLAHRYLAELGYGSGKVFNEQLASGLDENALFLDAGCGEGNLRSQLPETVRYVGTDHSAGEHAEEYPGWTHHPDIVADVHALPIATEMCDRATLFQVLEHVKEPVLVLSELYRVLKPGSLMFLTSPFMHQIHHAPDDYYRYTCHGLDHLFDKAGFHIEEIKPSGGYFRMLSHMLGCIGEVLSDAKPRVRWSFLPITGLFRSLGWFVGKLEYVLDLQDKRQEFTCGYHCILRKPGPRK